MPRQPPFSLQDLRRRRRAAVRKVIALALLVGLCHLATLLALLGLAAAAGAIYFVVSHFHTPVVTIFSFAGLVASGWIWLQLEIARAAGARSAIATFERNKDLLSGLDEQCRSRAAEQLALDEAKALGDSTRAPAQNSPARRL